MATTSARYRTVGGHPLRDILLAYPLAFFTGAFATDVIYARSTNMMWADFSIWMIAAGLLMGALAMVAGIVDAIRSRGHVRRERRSWSHMLLFVLMMAVALVNAFVHSRDAWTSVVPTGLILSAIAAVLAIASSWLGYSSDTRQELA